MGLEFVFYQAFNGQGLVNRIVFGGSEAIEANANAIAAYCVARWSTELTVGMSTGWTMYEVKYRDSDAVKGTPYKTATVPLLPIAGQSSTFATATQVATLVNTSGTTQAPWRGRVFLGGFTGGQIGTNSKLAPAWLEAVNAWAEGIQEAGAVLGIDIVWSIRSSGTIDKETGEVKVPVGQLNPITNAIPSDRPSALRSRKQLV